MASPQQILDDLVQLFHSDRGEPLVRYIAGVSLVKSLTVIVMEKREQLRPIFFEGNLIFWPDLLLTVICFRAIQRSGIRKHLAKLSSGCAATSIH